MAPDRSLHPAKHGRNNGRKNDPAAIMIKVDGDWVQACEGMTVAAALVSVGIWHFGDAIARRTPRGPFCGMGACFECEVTIDDEEHVQACLRLVKQGMVIQTK